MNLEVLGRGRRRRSLLFELSTEAISLTLDSEPWTLTASNLNRPETLEETR